MAGHKLKDKQYLGDGVYVEDLGHMLKLYTDSGSGPEAVIFMEAEVINAFIQYLQEGMAGLEFVKES